MNAINYHTACGFSVHSTQQKQMSKMFIKVIDMTFLKIQRNSLSHKIV
jgi:hypothetical protein